MPVTGETAGQDDREPSEQAWAGQVSGDLAGDCLGRMPDSLGRVGYHHNLLF